MIATELPILFYLLLMIVLLLFKKVLLLLASFKFLYMSAEKISVFASVTKLHKNLVRYKKDIWVVYMFAVLAGLVQLSLPLGIQSIIGFVMAGSISTSIVVLICLVLFGVFINGLLQVKQMEIIEKIKQQLFLRSSVEYSYDLPRLDAKGMNEKYLPEVANRFFDSVSLQKSLDKILLELPAAVIQMLLGILLLAFYHPVFIGLGTVLILYVVFMLRFTSARGLTTALDASSHKYKMAAWLQEIARCIVSFKQAAGNMMHMQQTDAVATNYLTAHGAHFKILVRQYWSLISFKVLITASMLIIGALLLVNNQINVGQFVAADIVIIVIITSVEKLINNIDVVYEAIVSSEKLGVIADAEKEETGTLGTSEISQCFAIEFKNVHFNYGGDMPLLKDISFKIPAGKIARIAGENNAGKKTILKLLAGMYNNFSGGIFLDGIPAGNYDICSIRKCTGVMMNDQAIFEASLLQNLTMGNPTISLHKVSRLAAITGLQSFVEECKSGYDTVLQSAGQNLSQSTIQNILLVRALLAGSRLLLLQEPLTHLQDPYKTNVANFIAQQKITTVFTARNNDDVFLPADVNINL